MPTMVQRKNQARIGDPDKNMFINGINAFNSLSSFAGEIGGTYGTLVSIHRHQHNFHSPDGEVGTQRFLTWHRIYLSVLEFWISSIPNYQKFFIPYWDWTTDRTIPTWVENFKPQVNVPNTEKIAPGPISWDRVTVQRSPGKPEDLPTKKQIDDCLALPSYTEFTTTLEGLHAGVHAWVGGTMSDIATSPADPLFWMHHANIDRIYTLWQRTHPDNPNTIPNLSGSDLNMDPWEGTEPDYRHWDWIAYVAN
jgi:tyrosinase